MIGYLFVLVLLGAPESANEDSLAGITCVVIYYPEDEVLSAVRVLGKLTPDVLKSATLLLIITVIVSSPLSWNDVSFCLESIVNPFGSKVILNMFCQSSSSWYVHCN